MSNTPGVSPRSAALDLSTCDFGCVRPVTGLWSNDLGNHISLPSGDVWIDYPFGLRWQRLDQNYSDPELARDVKTRLEGLVQGLLETVSSANIGKCPCEYILTELITNATQYGSMSNELGLVGILRLRWKVSKDREDPSIEIKLSNPTQRVFDVGKYACMTQEDWLANLERDTESGDDTNGHIGVITIASLVKSGSDLRYEWELSDGGQVVCVVRPYFPTDEDRPADDSSLLTPLRITAEKFDKDGQLQPYSYGQLKRDLATEGSLLATTVTVSCIIGRATPDSPADTTVA